MNTPSPDLFSSAFAQLAERCQILGVPLWHFDATGKVTASPAMDDALTPWLAGDDLRGRLEAAARAALAEKRLELVALFPGAWFLPLDERDGAARVGLTAAVIFT